MYDRGLHEGEPITDEKATETIAELTGNGADQMDAFEQQVREEAQKAMEARRDAEPAAERDRPGLLIDAQKIHSAVTEARIKKWWTETYGDTQLIDLSDDDLRRFIAHFDEYGRTPRALKTPLGQ